ncbi:MAG TPA: DUF4112 domain-containing protein [Thermoanaerobaculia bacterium]|nr:DUF4112 domain-containing protein [Thermoanaerobaculia bacterium]
MSEEPQRIYIPEVIEPDSALPRDLLALRRFATLLDAAIAIPGTKRRIGLDAGLGLIPGVGDVIGAAMSAWILMGAFRHRVPTRTLGRMLVNILIDLGVGSIPVLGDIFDFFFQENVMNLQLLMQHRDRRRPPRSGAEIVVAAVLIFTILAAAGLFLLASVVMLIVWVAGQRT